MDRVIKSLSEHGDVAAEVAELLYGDGAWEIAKAFGLKQRKDNFLNGAATAGTAAGGIIGVSEFAHGLQGVARKGGRLSRIAMKVPEVPGGPKAKLALAGTMLGSDVLATKELRRKKQLAAPTPMPTSVGKSYEEAVDCPGGKLVKTGKKKTKVAKAGDDLLWRGEISKVDSDKRQVFGWASIVEIGGKPVVDLQGDLMDIDTIEKAAYNYVENSRKGGNQHAKGLHVSNMIESFIVTEEKKQQMGLPADMPTGWWVGFKVNDDETWNQVKNKERTEFSIHGSGVRKDIEVED